jgi:hypothetical protein
VTNCDLAGFFSRLRIPLPELLGGGKLTQYAATAADASVFQAPDQESHARRRVPSGEERLQGAAVVRAVEDEGRIIIVIASLRMCFQPAYYLKLQLLQRGGVVDK